jgi:hypothetical protein
VKLALALALAASPVAVSPLGLGELPPQVLQPNSCALFLWDRTSEKRVVMAVANPAMVRVIKEGKPVDLPQTRADGAAVLGFAPRATYGSAAFNIGLNLDIVPSEGGGAVIRSGAVTVTQADGSAVVAPVAGLVGCSSG